MRPVLHQTGARHAFVAAVLLILASAVHAVIYDPNGKLLPNGQPDMLSNRFRYLEAMSDKCSLHADTPIAKLLPSLREALAHVYTTSEQLPTPHCVQQAALFCKTVGAETWPEIPEDYSAVLYEIFATGTILALPRATRKAIVRLLDTDDMGEVLLLAMERQAYCALLAILHKVFEHSSCETFCAMISVATEFDCLEWYNRTYYDAFAKVVARFKAIEHVDNDEMRKAFTACDVLLDLMDHKDISTLEARMGSAQIPAWLWDSRVESFEKKMFDNLASAGIIGVKTAGKQLSRYVGYAVPLVRFSERSNMFNRMLKMVDDMESCDVYGKSTRILKRFQDFVLDMPVSWLRLILKIADPVRKDEELRQLADLLIEQRSPMLITSCLDVAADDLLLALTPLQAHYFLAICVPEECKPLYANTTEAAPQPSPQHASASKICKAHRNYLHFCVLQAFRDYTINYLEFENRETILTGPEKSLIALSLRLTTTYKTIAWYFMVASAWVLGKEITERHAAKQCAATAAYDLFSDVTASSMIENGSQHYEVAADLLSNREDSDILDAETLRLHALYIGKVCGAYLLHLVVEKDGFGEVSLAVKRHRIWIIGRLMKNEIVSAHAVRQLLKYSTVKALLKVLKRELGDLVPYHELQQAIVNDDYLPQVLLKFGRQMA